MKKTIKVLVVVSLMLSLTGCTKYIKDDKGKIVQNVETGQNLPSNILCKPEIHTEYSHKKGP